MKIVQLIVELVKCDIIKKLEIALIMISVAIIAVGLVLVISIKAQ